MSNMDCPGCGSSNTSKVIGFAMPMKLCMDCNNLWGEPWATIYVSIVAPVEMFFNGYSAFMMYDDNYFSAVWYWIKAGFKNDDD